MKNQCPSTLLECSLKPLVTLTISTLLTLDSRYDLKVNVASEEPLLRVTGKRKVPHQFSLSPKTEEISTKRVKRDTDEDAAVDNVKTILSDDDTESYTVVDDVVVLRRYLSCLPQNLWNKFFCSAVKALNNLDVTVTKSSLEIRTFELLFCNKVTSFSTKWMAFYVYDKCAQMIFERLRLCRNLKTLEISFCIKPSCQDIFLSSLSRLRNLRSAILLPDYKQSLHDVFRVVSENCFHIEEFTTAYESDQMSNSGYNISCLEKCSKLRKLTLHSYGRGSEAEYIKILLCKLKNLRHFYHKELPHAVIDMFEKNLPQNLNLNLKTLFLSSYSKCVGSQLCYLPEESLIKVAKKCPFLEHLKIVKPPNISQAIAYMPSLQRLEIHDCDIKECFAYWSSAHITNLSSLSLKNGEYMDFGDILLLSRCCPQLQELQITNINMYWSNALQTEKNLFPHLRILKIEKNGLNERTEPRFVYPHKLCVDKTLLRVLLSGERPLEVLHLEFDYGAVRDRDTQGFPSEDETIEYIGGCKNLTELKLISCPLVSYRMVKAFVDKCTNLKHLLDIDQWNIPESEMDQIIRKFSYMFKQSYEPSNYV